VSPVLLPAASPNHRPPPPTAAAATVSAPRGVETLVSSFTVRSMSYVRIACSLSSAKWVWSVLSMATPSTG
ncbi:hypothetical protein BaRGS_00008466, partial [Batillaria attramentaria]